MNFIFVSPHKDIYLMCLYNDFYLSDKVDVVNESFELPSNSLIRLIKRIHLSIRVEEIINLPFKALWCVPLEDYPFNKGEKYCILFLRDSLPPSPNTLIKIKKKYNVQYALLLTDPKNSKAERKTRLFMKHGGKGIFDYIFTLSPTEAGKYGYMFFDTIYSKVAIDCPQTVRDLFFVGLDKGRLNTLYDILNSADNASCMFYISGVQKKKQRQLQGIIFNERIDYLTTLHKTLESNCILEIIPQSVTAQTSRYYEAVCYNKKLLTNNKYVVNLPFYDPRYMKVFENPEDINWNWVKERIPVDYHYDGRFSPTHLIDKIIELEEAKEK